MTKLKVGAVIYDPKVTVIWGIIAKFFEDDWQNLMGGRQFIEPKELLNAFIEKCYENYSTLKAVKNLATDVEETLKREER